MKTSFTARCVRVLAMIALLAVVAMVVPVGEPDRASAATGCAVNYTVVRGDSWWRIKSKAGKSLSSVLRANGAKTSTRLLVGRTICLPAGSKVGTAVGGTPTTREASNRLSLGAPATRYSTSASKRIIREVFPKRLESRALAIAKRESKYKAAAHNWCCVGLFQINWFAHSQWLGEMGVTEPEMLMDARVNAKAAFTLYKRAGGWGPWQ